MKSNCESPWQKILIYSVKKTIGTKLEYWPVLPTTRVGSLRSYDGNCNENVALKLNLVFSGYSMLYKIGVVQNRRGALSLAWDECFFFHVNTKNERLTSRSSSCHENLKYENFKSSFGRLRQNIAAKSVPHV